MDTPEKTSHATAAHAGAQKDQVTLARNIGLFALIVYGVGDMVGAGIYATIGTAAGLMGNAIWMPFLVSMVAALLTGISYASLASRYPRAGGAAYVVNRAFGLRFVAYVVGLAVAASGLTSMAAGSNAVAENLLPFLFDPEATGARAVHITIVVIFLLLLALINFIGIKESIIANIIFTAVEVGGLVFIIIVGAKYWGTVDYMATPANVDLSAGLILTGAVLAFYGFIGFEDMLNVAEEVKEPQRTMPWGIIIAIIVTTTLYMLISITAVSIVPAADLANRAKGLPFSQMTAVAAPWLPGWVFGAITIFAVANTALLNYIMGSRLLFGMARQGLLPRFLSAIHAGRRTPHLAIATLGIIVLILAFMGNVGQLASATSLLLLTCFCVVNMGLVALKARKTEPLGHMEVPYIVPILGALVCLGLIITRIGSALAPGATTDTQRAPLIAVVMLLIISALYFVLKPKEVVTED